MKQLISRYTADIEIPDGIISVDCEARNGEKTEVLFLLNRSSLRSSDPTSGSFRNLLENHGEIILKTADNNPERFIKDTLVTAYGAQADISVTATEFD